MKKIIIRKKKVFKVLSIITLVITIIVLSLSLYLNISEIIAMKECANTPGCMYCIPGKSIVAFFGYTISFFTFISTIVFFVLYKKNK